MFQKNLIELQNTLKLNGILISFSGRFSQGIIEELGEAIKKHMEEEAKPKSDIFNVFAIFIEQTQNIKNYITIKKNSTGYDIISNSNIVTIGNDENHYFICSGNIIENPDVEPLIITLEKLKTANKEELKKMYKEQRKKELPDNTSNAGLGLIEIARKASKPLEYSITEAGENLSFFVLIVTV